MKREEVEKYSQLEVKITFTDNDVLSGFFMDIEEPGESDQPYESIYLDIHNGDIIDIPINEIKEIELII